MKLCEELNQNYVEILHNFTRLSQTNLIDTPTAMVHLLTECIIDKGLGEFIKEFHRGTYYGMIHHTIVYCQLENSMNSTEEFCYDLRTRKEKYDQSPQRGNFEWFYADNMYSAADRIDYDELTIVKIGTLYNYIGLQNMKAVSGENEIKVWVSGIHVGSVWNDKLERMCEPGYSPTIIVFLYRFVKQLAHKTSRFNN